LHESNEPEFEQDLEQPEVESLLALQFQKQRFQDVFDPNDQSLGGVDTSEKRSPAQIGLFDKVLTTEDFEQRLQETLDGTSERAQHAKQVESVYEVYFKDTEDFPVADIQASVAIDPERFRYEAAEETASKGRAATVPEFQAVVDPAEAAREQQAARAADALLDALGIGDDPEESLPLLGKTPVRA
jgi:hypothetical protein